MLLIGDMVEFVSPSIDATVMGLNLLSTVGIILRANVKIKQQTAIALVDLTPRFPVGPHDQTAM
jgi:hypothetical protein